MTFQSDLYDFLVADAEIAAAVSTDEETTAKVYHQQAAQGESPPYLVFLQVTGENVHHMGGGAALAWARYQIDCVGDSNTTDPETIAEAVRNRCDGYSGTMGSTDVRSMLVLTRREQIDDPGDGSETWVSRVILEMEVWYAQAVPTG